MIGIFVHSKSSRHECLFTQVAGVGDSFYMVCFNMVLHVLISSFLFTNCANPNKVFTQACLSFNHHWLDLFIKFRHIRRKSWAWNSNGFRRNKTFLLVRSTIFFNINESDFLVFHNSFLWRLYWMFYVFLIFDGSFFPCQSLQFRFSAMFRNTSRLSWKYFPHHSTESQLGPKGPQISFLSYRPVGVTVCSS